MTAPDDRPAAAAPRRPRHTASKNGHQGAGYNIPASRACKGCGHARWNRPQYDCRLFAGCTIKRYIPRDEDGFARMPKTCSQRTQK